MIRVCEPDTTDLEKKYVLEALENNWISPVSPPVERLEKAFSEKIGVKHTIAVDSGWGALILSLRILGIRKGDEVILPTFTMIASANAIRVMGAVPVFVDSELNGNIDVDLIEEKITPQTRAIMPVHIYGHPCDMEEIWDLTGKYGISIIEDAAESLGSTYMEGYTGTLGDIAAFSLYANKTITAGQGGLITTDNDNWARELRALRAYDFHPEKHFVHRRISGNNRIGGLQAAYCLGQVKRMDELVDARIANAEFYTDNLRDLVGTPTEKDNVLNTYWMYGIVTASEEERDALMRYLHTEKIETRTFFFPMHWQKPYKSNEEFPVADMLGKRGMYLPSSSGLKDSERSYVVKKIREFYEER